MAQPRRLRPLDGRLCRRACRGRRCRRSGAVPPRPRPDRRRDHRAHRGCPSRRVGRHRSCGRGPYVRPVAPAVNDRSVRAYVPRVLPAAAGTAAPGYWGSEGTLVFADISGFTRLTEKLSQQGKIGAEQIVQAISSVFTALLTATKDGGDVLKFSGDALLLFYEGEDHEHRACHAALTMQRTLRAVGGIDSSRGRVRLRMAVGVHTGRFHFFLCGGDHLELFVLGADASTTVAM